MSKKPERVRRTCSEELKRDAVKLVVEQDCSFASPAKAVNVSGRSLREWHEKYAPEPDPCGAGASVEELTAENAFASGFSKLRR